VTRRGGKGGVGSAPARGKRPHSLKLKGEKGKRAPTSFAKKGKKRDKYFFLLFRKRGRKRKKKKGISAPADGVVKEYPCFLAGKRGKGKNSPFFRRRIKKKGVAIGGNKREGESPLPAAEKTLLLPSFLKGGGEHHNSEDKKKKKKRGTPPEGPQGRRFISSLTEKGGTKEEGKKGSSRPAGGIAVSNKSK